MAKCQHLRSAHGYIELGMFEEANAELEEIDTLCRSVPEILITRVFIYHGLQRWDLMAVVAGPLAQWNLDEAGYFINLAYAKRRAEGLHLAHAVLKRAAELHPENGTVQFNLACHEAQLGNLGLAKAHLSQATKIDQKFSLMVVDDPDLEPLWVRWQATDLDTGGAGILRRSGAGAMALLAWQPATRKRSGNASNWLDLFLSVSSICLR